MRVIRDQNVLGEVVDWVGSRVGLAKGEVEDEVGTLSLQDDFPKVVDTEALFDFLRDGQVELQPALQSQHRDLTWLETQRVPVEKHWAVWLKSKQRQGSGLQPLQIEWAGRALVDVPAGSGNRIYGITDHL